MTSLPGKSGLVVALFALTAMLALPTGAVAKPGYTVKPKSLHLKLQLPASNGYSASMVTNGHRQVVLSLARGGVAATYTALGRVTRKRIEADFGSLGHVSLRFRGKRRYHPKDPLSFLYRGCKGRKTVEERGVLVGSVRFEGERGFAQVHAHRAVGASVRSYRRVCKDRFRPRATAAFRSSAPKPSEEDLFVVAQAKDGGVLRSVFGFRSAILGLSLAVGSEKRKLGRVAVLKSGVVIDYPRAIRISPRAKRPVTARVKLARPFEGSASYSDEGKAPPTWSGTLGLRLPGSGLVPLTGPEFEAEICRAFTTKEILRCTDRLLEQIQLLRYGSGSHSQPLALARLSSLR